MKLLAWFDPKLAGDPMQMTADRQALGEWTLREVEISAGKRVYTFWQDICLNDGASLRVSVTHDCSPPGPITTLGVASGTRAIVLNTVRGRSGFSTYIATGKGGYLELQMRFDDEGENGSPRLEPIK